MGDLHSQPLSAPSTVPLLIPDLVAPQIGVSVGEVTPELVLILEVSGTPALFVRPRDLVLVWLSSL